MIALLETESPEGTWAVRDVRLGRHDDLEALRDFARGCDVVTFDHEHVPPLLLKTLQDEGVAVRPGGRALVHAQDKIVMREALAAAGVPCPLGAAIDEVGRLEAFGARVFAVDGHDLDALAAPAALEPDGRPLVVLALTDPARGVEPLRKNAPKLHYLRFKNEDERQLYASVLSELG